MLKVVEMFDSIDGEGIRSGYPVTFIRLYGCNLRCSFCDTSYSYDNSLYTEMTVEQIVSEVKQFGFNRITLTGGEPLFQKESNNLISKLLGLGFEVNLETNGSIHLEQALNENLYNENLIITMDWKSLSSGMSDKMFEDNLVFLDEYDVLKFVVGCKEDLNQMKDIVSKYSINCNIFVSPVFGQIEPKDIVEYLIDNNLQNVRIQLQLHKYIWPVDMRGV